MIKADRKHIIEDLLQNMHTLKHKLAACYEVKDKVDITPSQGFVLRFVAIKKVVSVKDISEALQVSSSAATQIIDGLVQKDYLLRAVNSHDRRVVNIELSKTAKSLFAKIKNYHLKQMSKFFDALNDNELAQYAVLSRKIFNSLAHQNQDLKEKGGK